MRKDMAKVIVERPRTYDSYGSALQSRRKNQSPSIETLDELPYRERMKAHKGGTKQLNENLAPLRRFIASRCGRPWDKVYSEICEHLSVRTAVQKHVLDHLHQMVVKKTYLGVDGEIWASDGGNEYKVNGGHSFRFNEFYVDPKGFLRAATKKAREHWGRERAAEAAKLRRDVNKTTQYHKIDNIWYEVRLMTYSIVSEKKTYGTLKAGKIEKRTIEHKVAKASDGKTYTYFPSMVFGKSLSPLNDQIDLKWQYGRLGVFAISKRQLSRQELKRAELKNI